VLSAAGQALDAADPATGARPHYTLAVRRVRRHRRHASGAYIENAARLRESGAESAAAARVHHVFEDISAMFRELAWKTPVFPGSAMMPPPPPPPPAPAPAPRQHGLALGCHLRPPRRPRRAARRGRGPGCAGAALPSGLFSRKGSVSSLVLYAL
jgi:hypothetical protein